MDWIRPSLHVKCSRSLPDLERAYRIAMGDLQGNILPFRDGLLLRAEPCILAGLDYAAPWTRDAAINISNGAGLLFPIAARNSLLAVLVQEDEVVRIGGQYWDAVLWAVGAWDYYLFTGDRAFLKLALSALNASLVYFERREYDETLGLFRGPAVYGDGVAAYPARYADCGGSSFILDWRNTHPGELAARGEGMPMMALSTNAAYFEAYHTASEMARELDLPPNPAWAERADSLLDAIQTHFWDEARGSYRYLLDPWGGCGAQEGLGSSFALLFGLAAPEQAARVLETQVLTPTGVPCLWPPFERYTTIEPGAYGRHCGTVWPHVQGFWGQAALRFGRPDLFERELFSLAARAGRDNHFAELYHPDSGEIYGGWQETPQGIVLWASGARQTWSATAYLRLVLRGLLGCDFSTAGMRLHPHLPDGVRELTFGPLAYRGAELEISLRGPGAHLRSCRVNGQPGAPFVPVNAAGDFHIEMELE